MFSFENFHKPLGVSTAFGFPAFVGVLLTFMPGPKVMPPLHVITAPFSPPRIHAIPVITHNLKSFWPPQTDPYDNMRVMPWHDDMPEDKFTLYADWAYSETQPSTKPADEVQEQFKDIPIGSPAEEIKRICDAFGMDEKYMVAVARIESDFEPTNHTGQYIGLYQLSKHEFEKYGPTNGDILNPRDNAIAAAYKMQIEAALFKLGTRHIPSTSDLYLIHQQGIQGAAEHIREQDRIAWKSMCATDEGKQKKEGWCKKAIWGNVLPAVKETWKSVDALTSGAFILMWQHRVHDFLSHAFAPSGWHYASAHKPVKHEKKIAKHGKGNKVAGHHKHTA